MPDSEEKSQPFLGPGIVMTSETTFRTNYSGFQQPTFDAIKCPEIPIKLMCASIVLQQQILMIL